MWGECWWIIKLVPNWLHWLSVTLVASRAQGRTMLSVTAGDSRGYGGSVGRREGQCCRWLQAAPGGTEAQSGAGRDNVVGGSRRLPGVPGSPVESSGNHWCVEISHSVFEQTYWLLARRKVNSEQNLQASGKLQSAIGLNLELRTDFSGLWIHSKVKKDRFYFTYS